MTRISRARGFGVDGFLRGFDFDGAVERSQNGDTTVNSDLQVDRVFGNGDREDAALGVAVGAVQGGDAERETERTQLASAEGAFELEKMIFWNADEAGLLLAVADSLANGVRNGECFRPVGKAAFSFDFEKAGEVSVGNGRNFGLDRKRPAQRNANNALFFANARLVEIVAQFAADERGIAVERIQRERGRESFDDAQRTI